MSKKMMVLTTALLAILWIIDLPQTVRAKVAILKALPISPHMLNSKIEELCAGAHSGNSVRACYASFYSREAAKEVAAENRRKQLCAETLKMVEADKNWIKHENSNKENEDLSLSYMYLGDDESIHAKLGSAPSFYPKKCMFFSISKGASTFN